VAFKHGNPGDLGCEAIIKSAGDRAADDGNSDHLVVLERQGDGEEPALRRSMMAVMFGDEGPGGLEGAGDDLHPEREAMQLSTTA